MKNLKQFALVICLAFFVALINIQFVQAQENKPQDNKQSKETKDENPSLQETFDWLKSKLDKHRVNIRDTVKGTAKYGTVEKPYNNL